MPNRNSIRRNKCRKLAKIKQRNLATEEIVDDRLDHVLVDEEPEETSDAWEVMDTSEVNYVVRVNDGEPSEETIKFEVCRPLQFDDLCYIRISAESRRYTGMKLSARVEPWTQSKIQEVTRKWAMDIIFND